MCRRSEKAGHGSHGTASATQQEHGGGTFIFATIFSCSPHAMALSKPVHFSSKVKASQPKRAVDKNESHAPEKQACFGGGE